MKKELIGEILLKAGKITKEQLHEALEIQTKSDRKKLLGEILIEKKWVSEDDVMIAYALQYDMEYLKLSFIEIPKALIDKFAVEFICKYTFIPVKEDTESITIALSDINNMPPLPDMELIFKKKFKTVLSTRNEIIKAICENYKISIEDYKKYNKTFWNKEKSVIPNIHIKTGEIKIDEKVELVVVSDVMKTIVDELYKVSQSDVTVLLYGETGTGKEILASFIHYNSPRKKGPFIKVNCGALPETLIESELFGYEKGAFTGAYTRKLGRFEMANNGTIFLDEIGELSISTQTKFLRILQDGEFERLGGNTTIKVNTRVIAATNKNLELEIKNGKFRQDLFYRLNVISFFIPPLRERREEIPYLVEFFIKKFNNKHQKKVKYVSPKVLDLLQSYDWPGNIRELENCIERAVVLTESEKILLEHLPYYLKPLEKQIQYGGISLPTELINPEKNLDLIKDKKEDLNLKEAEKNKIIEALKISNFNINKAAQILGIHRNTLARKIKIYSIKI